MEVEASWLEPDEPDPAKPSGRPSAKMPAAGVRPRALSKAAMPKADGPPRRDTIEVHADWLEADEPPPAANPAGGPRRPSGGMRRPSKANVARVAGPPPLPPQEPKAKAPRPPWEPPPLPPPPATAARARRALPPPLPRGEDEPERPAPRRPSKPPQR